MIGRLIYLLQERCNATFNRFKIETLKEGITSREMFERFKERQGENSGVIISKKPASSFLIPFQSTLAKSTLQFRIKRPPTNLDATQRGRRYIGKRAKFVDAERPALRAELLP